MKSHAHARMLPALLLLLGASAVTLRAGFDPAEHNVRKIPVLGKSLMSSKLIDGVAGADDYLKEENVYKSEAVDDSVEAVPPGKLKKLVKLYDEAPAGSAIHVSGGAGRAGQAVAALYLHATQDEWMHKEHNDEVFEEVDTWDGCKPSNEMDIDDDYVCVPAVAWVLKKIREVQPGYEDYVASADQIRGLIEWVEHLEGDSEENQKRQINAPVVSGNSIAVSHPSAAQSAAPLQSEGKLKMVANLLKKKYDAQKKDSQSDSEAEEMKEHEESHQDDEFRARAKVMEIKRSFPCLTDMEASGWLDIYGNDLGETVAQLRARNEAARSNPQAPPVWRHLDNPADIEKMERSNRVLYTPMFNQQPVSRFNDVTDAELAAIARMVAAENRPARQPQLGGPEPAAGQYDEGVRRPDDQTHDKLL